MPRWIFGVVAIVGILILGSVAGFYAYNQSHYVDSPYAYVSAPYVWIKTPSQGRVNRILVHTDERVAAGTPVAQVTTLSGAVKTIVALKTGIVGSLGVAEGASVNAGADLMAVVQLNRSHIMANIPESSARRLAVGQFVNVTVSAYPGTTFSGRISHVGTATLSTLSPLLHVGSFSKTRQWVPVTITVNPGTDRLIAGENASVRIHI